MSTDHRDQAVPLDLILGPQLAGTVIRAIATTLQHDDHLPEILALRLACERATDGDPLVLAAPGQIWELREGIDPDDAPARRLAVHLRVAHPPRVYVSDPDETAGEIDELLLEVLDLYTLVSWDVRFLAPNPAVA
ncbi:hypothetical protein ACFRKE_01115 [Kitasatospora indigofera]|uniref:hypothetical protein n=1 Tax=Kitasatospora indigofera TaxID=67307 RepID=UPI0036977D0D